MNCQKCGAPMAPNQVFCMTCGAQVAQQASQQAQPQYQSPQPQYQPPQYQQPPQAQYQQPQYQPYGQPPAGYGYQPNPYAPPRKPVDVSFVLRWIIFGLSCFLVFSLFLPSVAINSDYKYYLGGSYGSSYSIVSFFELLVKNEAFEEGVFAVIAFGFAVISTIITVIFAIRMLLAMLKNRGVNKSYTAFGMTIGIIKFVECLLSPISILTTAEVGKIYSISVMAIFNVVFAVGVIVLSAVARSKGKYDPSQNFTYPSGGSYPGVYR